MIKAQKDSFLNNFLAALRCE